MCLQWLPRLQKFLCRRTVARVSPDRRLIKEEIEIEIENKKSSGAAHQSDPRHQAVKTAYLAGTARAGIANPDWNGADGKALNDLLKHHAGVGADTIVRWLENAFVSAREGNGPLQPKFRFTEFCRHSMKYQTGPAGPPAWKSGSNGHRREDTPTQADLERMLAERGIPGSRPV